MNPGSNWYEDPAILTAEVQRASAGRAPTPVISGYDGLIEIARGGQGVVFKAVQRSTRRPVAIKVLLDGELASGVARRRFEREIDLVASLRHPHIVSVYDSGSTIDGRLYLVMEFVEGVALDQAGAAPNRPVRETLQLVATIADALQYAHQRGVIHRDLKPSNIRVDAAGSPHILDFGLAKVAADQSGAAQATLARATLSTSGQFMGSLPWASPEQATGTPDSIDARTDVYALGVMLHQLLTGRFPYDVTGGLKTVLDNIVSAEPTRADAIRPEVGDEVATIIAKSLSKNPERRYQSAGELARDIRHYLAGEPIEAKRDSAWYTVSKTLRRYRLVAMAAAAFVVLLAAALIVSIRFGQEASRQRDEARSQSARVGTINEFVLDMLGAVDPDKDGPNIKVVELLDRAALTVDTRYAGQDDLRESLHQTLLTMYTRLGHFPQARAQAEQLIAIRRTLYGEDNEKTLSAEADLSLAIAKGGNSKEAEPIARRVYETQRRLLGPMHLSTLSTLTNLSQTLRFLARSNEAVELSEPVLPEAIRTLGPDHDTVLAIEGNLAQAYHDLGRFKDAEPLYRDVLERRTRVQGPEHTETLTIQNNLATLLLDQNRLQEADPIYRAHLESLTRRLGPDNIDVLTAKNNLAKLLQDEGKLDEAEPMMREAMDSRIRILGEDHPHSLVSMNNMAALYARLKRYDESESIHRRVLAIRTAKLGPEHIDTIITTNNLAGTLRDSGRYSEALPLYERAVSVTDRTLPPGHHFNALFRMNLGFVLFKLNRFLEAEEKLLAAKAALLSALGAAHPQTRLCVQNLVKLYTAWEKPDKASALQAELDAPPPPSAK